MATRADTTASAKGSVSAARRPRINGSPGPSANETDGASLGPVGAVVVHYGSWEPTRRAVSALVRNASGAKILVVDNGPGTAAPPPDLGVPVASPGRNLGYGAACNLGASRLASEMLLFVNNDVEVEPGAISLLVERLRRNPGLAAAGPRFFDASGRPRRSVKRAPTPWRIVCENLFLARLSAPLPAFHGHHTVFVDETRPREVETLLGALVLIRREAFESVRGFDESYFFYAEESDLFARLRRAGWRIAFEPRAHAIHHEGLASREVDQETLDRWLRDGLLRYARRFHGRRGETVARIALRTGARLRWLLSFVPGLPHRHARRSRYAAILRGREGQEH